MKIAIVKLSALGDIVHAMVILQFIKKYNEAIEIDWIVEKGNKELLESHPDINKVIVVNIKDVKQKKSAFFGYILPLVEAQNTLIQRKRDKLLELKLLGVDEYSRSQRNFLTDLAKEYRLTVSEITPAEVKQLISRVDQVPASLALAQAAMESAWGTSRFAVQANNLFGQWCYEKGCGLVPLRRNAGSKHEVAKFDSVSDAIKSYLRNINTHRAYSDPVSYTHLTLPTNREV